MISQSARLFRRLACIAVVASAAIGCSSQTVTRQVTVASTADQAVAIAVQQVGAPYRYGGATPSGFDCSGLVHYSYARAGKRVPRTTAALWRDMRPVAENELRAGDVLFFKIAGKMSHVGMYLGDDKFVHAPSTGKVVSIETLKSDFYKKAFIRAGRPQ